MTDLSSGPAERHGENSQIAVENRERPPIQWPSFIRRNDPIARLPFIGHWLLSLLLLILIPLGMLKFIEVTRVYGMLEVLMLIAILPGIVLYWTSARRRLVDLRMAAGWSLLIVPFVAVSLLNGYGGAMGMGAQPMLPPALASLLLLPAVVLHVILMVRSGGAVSVKAR